MIRFCLATSVATLALSAVPAGAITLEYTISGLDSNAQNQIEYASFKVDSEPTPDGTADGIGFYVAAIPGTFTYGATTTTAPQDISFYLDAAHGYSDPNSDPGGLFVGEGDLLGFSGPQIFSGSIDRPTLTTGTFMLLDAFSGSPIRLTVQAVPEPLTWVTMTVGFGLMGIALRRRRRELGARRPLAA